MGWVKRFLFGEGKVKFEGETTDGRTFHGTCPFEGAFDEKDCINYIVAQFEFDKNVTVKRVRLTGILAECAQGDNPYTGEWYDRKVTPVPA